MRHRDASMSARRALLATAWLALSCAGYADALTRGQRYYEDNQYERALAVWRELDRRDAAFSRGERARYAYFRGMTDYRLGFRDDARHWLAIAKAAQGPSGGGLRRDWLERLDGALIDLEREALGQRADGRDIVQSIELAPSEAPNGAPPADPAQAPPTPSAVPPPP